MFKKKKKIDKWQKLKCFLIFLLNIANASEFLVGLFEGHKVVELLDAQFGPDHKVGQTQNGGRMQSSSLGIQDSGAAKSGWEIETGPDIDLHVIRLDGWTIDNRIVCAAGDDGTQSIGATGDSDKDQIANARFIFADNAQRFLGTLVGGTNAQLDIEAKGATTAGDLLAVRHIRCTAHQDDNQMILARHNLGQLLRYPDEVTLHRIQIGGGNRCQIAIDLLIDHQTFIASRPEAPRVRVYNIGQHNIAIVIDTVLHLHVDQCTVLRLPRPLQYLKYQQCHASHNVHLILTCKKNVYSFNLGNFYKSFYSLTNQQAV